VEPFFSSLEASSLLQLLEGKNGDSVAAGEAGGLLRLRWPLGRREVTESAGPSPAGVVGRRFGPSGSRVRFPASLPRRRR
jgi:hypothetical protein